MENIGKRKVVTSDFEEHIWKKRFILLPQWAVIHRVACVNAQVLDSLLTLTQHAPRFLCEDHTERQGHSTMLDSVGMEKTCWAWTGSTFVVWCKCTRSCSRLLWLPQQQTFNHVSCWQRNASNHVLVKHNTLGPWVIFTGEITFNATKMFITIHYHTTIPSPL